jgi:guanylate kinase
MVMNQLLRASEFRQVLSRYHPNDDVKKTLSGMRLLLFVAPTATGRDTIIHELLKTGHYVPLITDTTRQPRINNGILEQHGREYWFRGEDEMLEELAKGDLAGAAMIHNQQVSGISRNQLIAAQINGKIAVTDIDVQGAMAIHQLKPDTIVLFMVPLSFDIWMERLHSRGNLLPDEIGRRMESAERELSTALKADYFRFILNDTLEGSTAEIDRLVMSGQYDLFKERVVREITGRLYEDVERYLGTHAHPTLK